MVSSLEEALMLLNKWKSSRVSVTAVVGAFSSERSGMGARFIGVIDNAESGTFALVSGENFFFVDIHGCDFNFEANFRLPEIIAKFVPQEHDSFLSMRFSNSMILILFASPE